jgi:hypothetical protein
MKPTQKTNIFRIHYSGFYPFSQQSNNASRLHNQITTIKILKLLIFFILNPHQIGSSGVVDSETPTQIPDTRISNIANNLKNKSDRT